MLPVVGEGFALPFRIGAGAPSRFSPYRHEEANILSNHAMTVLIESAIQRIIPHRYPFLLVDRVTDLIPGMRITAIKHFSINDEATQGYFPKTPMVPGSILIEALTQLGAILVLAQPEMRGKLAVILNVPGARTIGPVRPGDTLRLEAEVIKLRAGFGELRGTVYRDGALLAEGQMRFAIANTADLLPGQTEGQQ